MPEVGQRHVPTSVCCANGALGHLQCSYAQPRQQYFPNITVTKQLLRLVLHLETIFDDSPKLPRGQIPFNKEKESFRSLINSPSTIDLFRENAV
jgi:hypothetical protein